MSRASFSVAMTSQLDSELRGHLLQKSGQEFLCFALWNPSEGRTRKSALLFEAIPPRAGDALLHGNASFTAHYFERAMAEAASKKSGLAFLHSHLGPGWQAMSRDDVVAEERMSPPVMGATGFPLVGLTLGTDGAWSARFWTRDAPRHYVRNWCTTVRVVGTGLRLTYMDQLAPRPVFREHLERTISAWGSDAQAHLARMRVGVVGAGSVGAVVSEGLVRTGFEDVMAIDFDSVEMRNLDRLLHATERDVGKLKVNLLEEVLPSHATAAQFRYEGVPLSVCEEAGFRAALDCDALISCVDRPWGRSVLNYIAFTHLIPVIDGGIRVRVTPRLKLRGADWRAHISGPNHRCLECLQQYSPADVQLEREGFLDDPKYIEGLPMTHHLRRNENVFAFSLNAAGLQLLQLLMMVIAPSGISDVGSQTYHFVPGSLDRDYRDACNSGCPYPNLIAAGDRAPFVVTGTRKIRP